METGNVLGELSDDELDALFSRVVEPRRAAAKSGDGFNSIITDVKRLSSEELARVQALAGADEWFLEGDGKPVGPLSTAQMKERWLAHQINPQTRCWGVGLPGWTPLVRITALVRMLGPQPSRPIRTPRPPPPQHPTPTPVKAATPPPVEKREVLPDVVPPPQPPAPRPVAPVLSAHRRSRPLARPEAPYEAEDVDVAPRSTGRGLNAVMGAMIGVGAVAVLIAFVALPPLLSPPSPRAPPPEVTPPAPAPVPAAQTQAKAGPAKTRVVIHERPTPIGAGETTVEAPAPRESPDVEAAFDRAFPPEPKAGPSQPVARSVYVPPTPPPPKIVKPRTRLSEADVMAVVVAHKREIVKCRDAARAEDPDFEGKLLMRWRVSVDGEPEDVEPLPGDLQETDLAACVSKAIWGWKFPRHTEEQPPITFPFVF